MKRYNNIYEKICTIENLENAHRNARKDKAYYKEVKMVNSDPKFYLTEIQKKLLNQSYEVSKYTTSLIRDKGKERELMKLPYYPDRIIQWAIMLQIEDILCKTMTSFTCASLKDRGIHKAPSLVRKFMRNKDNTKYCLKIDIRKFYPSIDHKILKNLLRRKFKDKKLLELLDKIVDSTQGDKGIPIGSYLSQYFANFYLTYFDHWLKETQKVECVVRYMDDIVVLHSSKDFLHALKRKMDEYLKYNLLLDIKDNWQIFPTGVRGVDFVGYRHFYGYTLLGNKTCKSFKKKMISILENIKAGVGISFKDICSVNSYKGWLKWCDSYRLIAKYVKPIEDCFV